MTKVVVSIEQEADIDECVHKMEQKNIRRILVVDKEGNCCGIVSQKDIKPKTQLNELPEFV